MAEAGMFKKITDVKQELNTDVTGGGKEAGSEGMVQTFQKWT